MDWPLCAFDPQSYECEVSHHQRRWHDRQACAIIQCTRVQYPVLPWGRKVRAGAPLHALCGSYRSCFTSRRIHLRSTPPPVTGHTPALKSSHILHLCSHIKCTVTMAGRKRKAGQLEAESTTTATKTGKVINNTAAASRPKRTSASSPEAPSAKKRKVGTTKSTAKSVAPAARKSVRSAKVTSAPVKTAVKTAVKAADKAVTKSARPVGRLKKSANKILATDIPGAAEPVGCGVPALPRLDSTSFVDVTEGIETEDEETAHSEKSIANDNSNDGRSYWLMKAEPDSRFETTASGKRVDVKFTIDDLRANAQSEPWDGIRNLSAQKNLRVMRVGDQAFFYESSCRIPGIVGTMEIVQEASPDQTAFSEDSPYYDPKSKPDNPKWQAVHVAFRRKFKKISLKEMQRFSKAGGVLAGMDLMRQSRLSVGKVTSAEWNFIQTLVDGDDEEEALPIRDPQSNGEPHMPTDDEVDDNPVGAEAEAVKEHVREASVEAEVIEQPTREASVDESMLNIEEIVDGVFSVNDVTDQSVVSADLHLQGPEVTSPLTTFDMSSYKDASEDLENVESIQIESGVDGLNVRGAPAQHAEDVQMGDDNGVTVAEEATVSDETANMETLPSKGDVNGEEQSLDPVSTLGADPVKVVAEVSEADAGKEAEPIAVEPQASGLDLPMEDVVTA